MSTEKVVEFVPLLNFENDYEILNDYPFTIRRKKDHYEISEFYNRYGYPSVSLNGDNYLKHRLIALQFIKNDDPEQKTEVDHKNKNRDDYHLENLRWVTRSENQRNKTSHLGSIYEFVDEIPEDAIVVDTYGNHEFEDYYYVESDDSFYFYNGVQYRKLKIVEDKDGCKCINVKSVKNKYVRIYYSKFKRLYGII